MAVDTRRRQVTMFDTTPQHHRSPGGHKVPKMFAYDSVFTEESSLPELCASALPDIIQGVVNGTDGCVFIFGYGSLGKTQTMMGSDVSSGSLGVVPCAISWLFHLIQEQRSQSAARFSVRVSAVEVQGRDETLRDLLAEVGRSAADPPAPAAAVYLREDPISGTQLENQSELRAPTAEKAASYLDAALASRSQARDGMSHLFFTLHLYQYRVERSGNGRGVAGGRSRLHLIDLGSGRTSRDSGHPALSLAAMGSVLMSLVNGQRHIPHRDSKLSQLLREALGSLACRACMVCQVSSEPQHSTESLQILQLANKMQRLRRRRAKLASNSSDSSSCDSFGVRRAGRLRPQMGLVAAASRLNAVTSQSEADYSSSSEQSCDTVIFMGKHGELTDNEHPPPALLRKLAQAASSGDDSDTGTETGSGGGRRVPRTNARARPSIGGRLVGKMTVVEALSTQREQWIDGPKAMVVPLPPTPPPPPPPLAPVAVSAKPTEAAAAMSVSSGERWIDGPNASPPTTEERRRSAEVMTSAPTPATPQLPPPPPPAPPQPAQPKQPLERRDAETQSEEPYESESSASTYSTLDRGNQRVLSDISEKTEETSGRSGQEGEEDDDGSRRGATRDDGSDAAAVSAADAVPERDEDEELNNEALERIEIPSPQVAPPSLFPSSTGERPKPPSGGLQQRAGPRLASSLPRQQRRSDAPADQQLLVARVKPFVRDWVEKHSAVSSCSESCCCDEAASCQCNGEPPPPPQPQMVCQSARSSPVHTLLRSAADKPMCTSLQGTPTHRQTQHLQSQHVQLQHQPQHQQPQHQHQKHQHQHRSRSSSKRSQSLQQPPPPPPSHARVAQWLQGVQPDDLCRAVAAAAAAASIAATPMIPAGPERALSSTSLSSSSATPTHQHHRQASGSQASDTGPPPPPAKEVKKAASKLASFLASPLFGKRSKAAAAAAAATAAATAAAATSSPVASPARASGRRRPEAAPSPVASRPVAAAPPPAPALVIPSPYHTVTQPRVSVHSSSGHGSDCSYNPLGPCSSGGGGVGGRGCGGGTRRVTGGASSGYESMLRDSEASSCHDTASERSGPAVAAKAAAAAALVAAGRASRRRASHHHRKSRSRSRSAPPAEDANADGDDDEGSCCETPQTAAEAERAAMEWQIRCEKVSDLLWQQEQLKQELQQAKGLLMADRAGWNFDLHVASSMDPESPGFLEALRKETSILRKRAHACKSHLMFVSCFDAKSSADTC